MHYGSESTKTRPCCIANKGFISVYGICIFLILLGFVSLITMQVQVVVALRRGEQLHRVELYALHYIRSHPPTIEAEESEETSQQYTAITLHYQEVAINITYEQYQVLASFILQNKQYQIQVIFDEELHILNVAYSQ